MKIKYTSRFLSMVVLCLQIQSANSQTYRWVDSSGKVHYSDREPSHHLAKQVKIKQIDTVKLSPVKTPPIKKSKFKVKTKGKTTVLTKCQVTKRDIQKLESSLKKRQSASDFDQRNKQLVTLRWQRLKNC